MGESLEASRDGVGGEAGYDNGFQYERGEAGMRVVICGAAGQLGTDLESVTYASFNPESGKRGEGYTNRQVAEGVRRQVCAW